jgi:hypothetical protein
MKMNFVEKLETEAGEAGDLELAAICQKALTGRVSQETWDILDPLQREYLKNMTHDEAWAKVKAVVADALLESIR